MGLKSGRIEELRFGIGSLTASSAGLFDVYTNSSLNGEVINISIGSNNFTNTGSLLFFFSGTNNTGTLTGDLILRIRAGSYAQTLYPFTQRVDNQGLGWTAGSVVPTSFFGNAPIRLVGSGLGDGASGLFVSVKYR